MIDCHNHVGAELGMYLRGEFPYAQHLRTLVREGGALGVERWIVFPMVTYLALDLPSLRTETVQLGGDVERVPYSFENHRLLEEISDLFPEEGALVYPFAILDPSREVASQIESLRELRTRYRIDGLKIQATMIQSPVTDLLGKGKAFLELAEEWDIPMLIHTSVLPADVWSQARDICDIAERTPGVRFCLAHSCRFDKTSLDRVGAMPNAWFDCSAHRVHCRLAAEDSPIVATPEDRFDSDYSDPSRVLLDLATAYPDKLMWGSDSPYYSYVGRSFDEILTLLSTYEEEVACVTALPEGLREKASTENTLQLLGART